MNVSKSFLRDFAYLANLYRWDAADIDDVKAQTRANPEPMRRYWTALATAHRAGYQQTPANGYERLQVWTDRNPAFVEQYAHAHEKISARIAGAREGISAGIAHACEGASSPLSDHYAPVREDYSHAR